MTMTLRFAIAALALAAPLAAQSGGQADVQLRNDCRLAAQIVRTGHPAPHRDWAYDFISRCSETGAAAVADAWREPPDDERMLQLLVQASARLRTRAVFTAIGTAARNPQNGRVIRTYAISMLYSFAWPGSSLSVRDLLQPRGDRPARLYAVSGDGGVTNGPDLGDAKTEVRTLLEEIVRSDPDAALVRAAREVLDRV